MAEQTYRNRDGSITVIGGGIEVGGVPSHKEDPALWQVVKHEEADIRKRFGWSSQQIDLAITRLGFPSAELVTHSEFLSWRTTRTRRWLDTDVTKWEAAARSLGLLK